MRDGDLAFVEAAEGDFVQQHADRGGRGDRDKRADDAEQHPADQDRDHADDGWDLDRAADHQGDDEVVLGQAVADVEGASSAAGWGGSRR